MQGGAVVYRNKDHLVAEKLVVAFQVESQAAADHAFEGKRRIDRTGAERHRRGGEHDRAVVDHPGIGIQVVAAGHHRVGPEAAVEQRKAEVHVGKDAAAGHQVQAGLLNRARHTVAGAELDAQLRVEPLALVFVDGREFHHAALEIVHAAVVGVLDVHVDVHAMDVERGAHIAADLEKAFGKPCRVGSHCGRRHGQGFLRIAVRKRHVVVDGVLLFLGRIQIERRRQAVVPVRGRGKIARRPGRDGRGAVIFGRIVVAVEIVFHVEHQFAGGPVVGQVAAHGICHPGGAEDREGVETAAEVAEEGVVAAVQAGAETVLGFGLEIEFPGRHDAFLAGRIPGAETRKDKRRTVRSHGRKLDRLVRRKVVQVVIGPVEDRVVEMHVEALQGIVDRDRQRRFPDAVEIDVIGAAHLHRRHLGAEGKQAEEESQYRKYPFHRFIVLSMFRRLRTCSGTSSPSSVG